MSESCQLVLRGTEYRVPTYLNHLCWQLTSINLDVPAHFDIDLFLTLLIDVHFSSSSIAFIQPLPLLFLSLLSFH